MSTGAFALESSPPFRQVGAGDRPIFRLDCAESAAFYAPGCLCVVGLPAAERFEAAISPLEASPDPAQGVNWANELWHRAELSMASASGWQDGAFSPECLTLYMNNECNLRCVYCYTGASQGPAGRLDLETIVAAAELVAENCRRKGIPFVVVLHGGGEPTLHRERVDGVMARLEVVAARHEVQLFRYAATNGVMPERKALWLAHRFDLIGLSCDGPADIHNSQRPGWDDRGTLHLLERTAHVLQEEGCRLHVRTTITWEACTDRQRLQTMSASSSHPKRSILSRSTGVVGSKLRVVWILSMRTCSPAIS
jgi:sulfatase maturation enzyme AslB (radical SAM superfamily)